MDLERKTLRVGTAVLVCALFFRLLASGVMETTVGALSQQEVAAALLFLETGRVVRTTPPEETVSKAQPVDEETVAPADVAKTPQPAVFSQADADLVEVRNYSGYDLDISSLLLQPLSWDLTGEEPTVLILHTHATESYVNSEGYAESSAYRTLDAQYNMVSVGDRLAELLEGSGISVIHDRTLHDYPSYNGSYSQARETLSQYLAQYPSIKLVLDLHRDAITDSSGAQAGYSLETDTGSAAQIMLVLGSDSGGLTHPNWQENLSLAVKLHAQLEKGCTGICRPLSLRTSRFNQDLTPGAVLVEMGAAGNTRQEALLSAEYLAQAIIALAHGSIGE